MRAPAATTPGAGILRAAWVGTAAFVATAVAAAAVPDAFVGVAVAVDLVLFAAGIAAFVWSFLRAAARSRTEQLAVTSVWFLAGSAPATVRTSLLGAAALQVVVALATAAVRPFTPLAFGVLVPLYGLGLSGAWGARHGRFPRRHQPGRGRRPGGGAVPPGTGQNATGGSAPEGDTNT